MVIKGIRMVDLTLEYWKMDQRPKITVVVERGKDSGWSFLFSGQTKCEYTFDQKKKQKTKMRIH